jgi:hypothetical protein
MAHDEMTQERRVEIQLALGRIFRMGSRPFQPGDIEDYERCREIIVGPYDWRAEYGLQSR